MEIVGKLSEFFLFSIGLGIGIFTPIASTKLTGVGLHKLMTSVTIGSICLAIVTHILNGSTIEFFSYENWFYYIALFCMSYSYLKHRDDKSPLMWTLYFVQNISLLYYYYLFFSSGNISFDFFFLLSSTLFLGVILYSMLLGHWYLVVPNLSEAPLKVSIIFLWSILVFKILLTAYAFYSGQDFFEQGTTAGGGYMFNWIILSMRVGWGHLIIGIMSIFTWKLVKMRSIQSATGILYAMTFFVFVGELISGFIFYRYGMYL